MDDKTISLSVDLSKFNHKATLAPMRKRLFPFSGPIRWALFAMFFMGYVGAAYFNRKYDTGAYNWIAWLGFGALLSTFALTRFQVSKIWRTVALSPSRSGIQSVSLDSEKISIRHPGFYTEIFWTHIVDVIYGRDGLLVLNGDMEAIPIPTNAIPSDMTEIQLEQKISNWIARAKA